MVSSPDDATAVNSAPFTLTLDYSGLSIPFGADAEGRLAIFLEQPVSETLSQTTSDESAVEPSRLTWQELPRQVDRKQRTISAVLPRLGRLMLATTAASSDGDFAVQPSGDLGDYQVGLYMGSATASYAFPVPAGQAGPAPNLTLTYDSAGVDGMHTNKNSQPGWTGIGWNLELGHIVRRMITCNLTQAPGELCLSNSAYFLVLNGVSSRIVDAGSGQFKLQSDPRWKITRLTSPNTNHPDTNKEYWLVVTPDGTKYRFGAEYEELTGGADLNSAFFTPVYDLSVCTSDPYRVCNKVWQWNLDRIEDTNGNVVTIFYNQETNYYNVRTFLRRQYGLYVRAGNPTRIEYTKRTDDGDVGPTAQVRFTTGQRCVGSCTWPADYPDTPGDLQCGATGTCSKSYPSFWSKLKLSQITTWITNTSTADWQVVNRWDLTYDFPTPPPDSDGDTSQKKLELRRITRMSADGSQSLPATNYTYTFLENRLNHPQGVSPMFMSRLSQVTNELGGSVGFSYDSNCPTTLGSNIRPPYDCFVAWDPYTGSGGWVIWRKYKVTQQVVNDGLGGPAQTTTFSYSAHTSHYNDDNRLPAVNGPCPGGGTNCAKSYWFDVRGYNIITVTEADGSYHEHRFFRGMDGDRLGVSGGSFSATVSRSDGSTLTDSNWLRGREYEVRYFAAGGVLLARQTTDYYAILSAGSGSDGAYFVAPSAITAWTYDANGANPKQTRTSYTYHDVGNVTRELYEGDLSTADDDRLVDRAYYRNQGDNPYIVDRLKWERTFAGSTRTADGTEKAMTAYAYDGQDFFSGTLSKGNLTQVASYHTISANYTNPAHYFVTTTQYDSYGRPVAVTDTNGHSTETGYDSVYGYAATITNSLGYTTTTVIDPGTGNVLLATDANGAITAHAYDAFGRLVKTWQPGETAGAAASTVEVTYTLGFTGTPSIVQVQQRTDLGGANTPVYLASWRFFDGIGRLIQMQSVGDTANQTVLSNQHYDVSGRLDEQSVAYLAANAPGAYQTPDWDQPVTRYAYDALGRSTQVTNTDGSIVAASYDRWTKTVVDENGHQRVADSDAFGQLVQVREYTGTVPAASLYAITGYAYDVLGQLTTVTGADGVTTTMTYDPLGRKVAMHDPDMGDWTYAYDAVGNLVKQRDARGQVICLYYDALNRPTGKHYRGDTSCPGAQPAPGNGLNVGYYYDEAGYGASLGRRTRAAVYDSEGSLDNRAAWTYDLRGRTVQESRTVTGAGGGTFTMQWGYDAADRMRWIQYPGTPTAVEQVNLDYNARGLVNHVYDNDNVDYVQDVMYDEAGRVILRELGNTGAPGNPPVLQTSYTYFGWSDANGRGHLSSIDTGSVQFIRYRYDAVGNVAQLDYQTTDPEHPIVRQYRYDALDRLTDYISLGSGMGEWLEMYRYAPNGNLIWRGLGSGANNYLYGQAQAATCPEGALIKAHAVVTATTPTEGTGQYCYDQNGNMRRRDLAGKTYTLSYDAENT